MEFKIGMRSGYTIIIDQLGENDPLVPLGKMKGRIGYHKDGCMGVIYAHREGSETWIACAKFHPNGCHLGFAVSSGVNNRANLKEHLERLEE